MRSALLHIALMMPLGWAYAYAQPARDAADASSHDTLKTYRAEEVVVRGESILPLISRSAQPHAVVTRREIEGANAVDISDAVGYSPGVFVRQYGGLGGLRTVSLRGTSAQQTTILIDGVRYRSSADGAFDLSNMPASALERIEVVRGGNGALYGANALGGVINLVTRSADTEPFRGGATVGIGSFGERILGIDLGAAAAGHRLDASLQSTATDGDYPFAFNEFGATSTVRRDNADFTNLFGRASWSYRSDAGGRLSLSAQGYRSQRGVPGAVVQGSREQLRARMDERDLHATASLSLPIEEWDLSFAGTGRLNALAYRDPDARASGPDGADNHYDESDWSGTVRGRRSIGRDGVAEATLELAHVSLRGDNLDPSAGRVVRRLQAGGAVSANWLFDEGAFGWETSVDAALRFDAFSDIPSAVSPSAGIVWRIGATPLRLRARAGTSYRAPSFSEQYYLNYGNVDLRPERSASYDAGFTYEAGESLVLESSFFLIATRDQIVSVPRSPVSWSAQNIARTRSRGIELGASGSLFEEMLGLRASYTLMRAEDRSGGQTDGRLLVYAPEEIFNGIADLHLGRYGIGASWQYVGHRFTLATNDPASALPHYLLVGANLSGRWDLGSIGIAARLEGSNIFGAEYQVVRNYPMPGRTFRMKVEIRYQGMP